MAISVLPTPLTHGQKIPAKKLGNLPNYSSVSVEIHRDFPNLLHGKETKKKREKEKKISTRARYRLTCEEKEEKMKIPKLKKKAYPLFIL